VGRWSGISPLDGQGPVVAHGPETLRNAVQEDRVEDAFDGFIAGNVKLVYFIGLFEVALLKFDQVAVVPGKEGDLEFRVWYFAD